jgi:hypothetical protein
LPPVQVTRVTTTLSPEPVCWTFMRHPGGGGTNESIPNPDGTVNTTFVVLAPLFSVGTARLYSWSFPAAETAGLIRACPAATAGTSSDIASATASHRAGRIHLFTGSLL